jgi:DNA-binding NarL/FixJ family response regulator
MRPFALTSSQIRILIVDDHAVVRKGLAAVIEPEPDLELVASAASGKQALELFRDYKPDITIMDLGLTPEMDGIQAIQAIRREFPDARIIVLSVHDGEEDIYRSLQAGAVTFLLKETLGDDLIPIIREVHSGGRPIPADVAQKLADREAKAALSVHEVEVLRRVAKGMRNKEIGVSLRISESTVQGYLKSIITKMKVQDRVEAVVVAIRRGIIRLD